MLMHEAKIEVSSESVRVERPVQNLPGWMKGSVFVNIEG